MDESGVTIRGVTGQIYWGYHLAGTVRGWTAIRTGAADPGTVTATIVHLDPFRAAQHPLTFVVPHAHGTWRWPIDSLEIGQTELVARLGTP